MRTINTARAVFLIIFTGIVLNSCNVGRCYIRKSTGKWGESVSFKLSIHGRNYFFEDRQANFYSDYSGHLVKKGFSKFKLIDDYDADSIAFPNKCLYDTSVEVGRFILKLPISMLVTGKVLLNDTIFFEKEFDKWTKLVDTSLSIETKPKKIQVVFKPEKDVLFNKYDINSQSVVYLVPDTCNTFVIQNIPLHSQFLGYKNLFFDRRRKMLCVDTSCIEFEKCK